MVVDILVKIGTVIGTAVGVAVLMFVVVLPLAFALACVVDKALCRLAWRLFKCKLDDVWHDPICTLIHDRCFDWL